VRGSQVRRALDRCDRRLDKGVWEEEQGKGSMRGKYNDGGCSTGPASRGTVFND
jgi:hypothetical protein